MKNIHVLPTDKPSRIFYSGNNPKLLFSKEPISFKTFERSPQNIYITSYSEEIKEGDYFLGSINLVYKFTNDDVKYRFKPKGKKIILTTDQGLIKDGVQAIDDEFLEWFVKNPSCEEIEVRKGFADETSYGYNFLDYKIIIPKEEPKQETLEELKKWKEEALIAHEINQKVIEKLMAEKKQMYSEEEVLKFTQTIIQQYKLGNTNIEQLDLLKETLQQFKNK